MEWANGCNLCLFLKIVYPHTSGIHQYHIASLVRVPKNQLIWPFPPFSSCLQTSYLSYNKLWCLRRPYLIAQLTLSITKIIISTLKVYLPSCILFFCFPAFLRLRLKRKRCFGADQYKKEIIL